MRVKEYQLFTLILILLLAACSSTNTSNPTEAVSISTDDLSDVPTDPEEAALVDESLRITTPIPTETPVPTNTLVPTATPFSAENFPQDMPESFAYDLVWVQGGALLRWDAHNGAVVGVVGMGPDAQIQVERPVVRAEVHEDRKAVVVLAEEEENTYSLALVDVWDYSWQELVTVQSRSASLFFSLSPDGKWLGYFTIKDQQGTDLLYDFKRINIETGDEYTLAACVDHYWSTRRICEVEPLWKPSSDWVAVHANAGLWLLDPTFDGMSHTALYEWNLLQPDVWFSEGTHLLPVPLAWSPNGNFLLVSDLLWEGEQTVVIEPNSGELELIPYAEYYYGSGYYQVSWLEDNRLMVFHMPQGNIANVYLYHVQNSEGQMLQLERAKELALDFDFYTDTIEIQQVSGNEVTILLGNSYNHFAIMRFDLNRLEFISGFEHDTGDEDYLVDSLEWSPDGGWLFAISVGELISTDGQYVFDLSNVLTEDAADFTFVPRGE